MATHALIPHDWREGLRAVMARTGTPQSQLVTAAVGSLLARAAPGITPDTPPLPRGSLVALVARIPAEHQQALHALAQRTRVRYSEWLRQAVADVLRAHGALPEAPPAPEVAPFQAATVGGCCGCGFRLMPGESAPCVDCREVA
jgi:hypothetical protein